MDHRSRCSSSELASSWATLCWSGSSSAPGTKECSLLAEATLALVLFSDATRIDIKALANGWQLPARLLGIGFPLTVIAGIVVGVLVLDLSWQEAGLLAAVLTPTDAALGAAVVTDERLPVRIRQALNVESGLNDGLAVPVVAVFAALVLSENAEFGHRLRRRIVK